jgi:hypothetical protein
MHEVTCTSISWSRSSSFSAWSVRSRCLSSKRKAWASLSAWGGSGAEHLLLLGVTIIILEIEPSGYKDLQVFNALPFGALEFHPLFFCSPSQGDEAHQLEQSIFLCCPVEMFFHFRTHLSLTQNDCTTIYNHNFLNLLPTYSCFVKRQKFITLEIRWNCFFCHMLGIKRWCLYCTVKALSASVTLMVQTFILNHSHTFSWT